MKLKPWTFLGQSELAATRIYRVLTERWQSPRTGREATFSVIDSPDWVNVLPVDAAGNAVLIRQFRFGSRAFTLEVPGGMVDPGEAPVDAAARELREETGHRTARLVSLGFAEPNPAIMNNRVHMFLAEACEPDGELELDEGEDIEVVKLPLDEVLAMLHRGQLSHALVALILHRYDAHRRGALALG